MKIPVPLMFAFTLLVSACAGSPQGEQDGRTHLTMPPTSSVHNYDCQSGETIAATYPSTDSAIVQYQGSSYNMKIAVSGSGARYVGDKMEWWTKGSGPGSQGYLLRRKAGGASGESIERCIES